MGWVVLKTFSPNEEGFVDLAPTVYLFILLLLCCVCGHLPWVGPRLPGAGEGLLDRGLLAGARGRQDGDYGHWQISWSKNILVKYAFIL